MELKAENLPAISDRLMRLEKLNIRLPKGYDLMSTPDLVAWIEAQEKSDAFKAAQERVKAQREKMEKKTREREEEKADIKYRAWGELDGQLFFTVQDLKGRYFFALSLDGALSFREILTLPYGEVHPQPLPISKTGESIPMVGVPLREAMEGADGITPGALFSTLKEHLTRYIDVKPLDMEMIIHYILLTWFYPKVSTIPYLRLLGDTGKGKSRILDCVADLCFLPIVASGASTSSGIMRFKELWNGTLRIDEADLRNGDTTHELIKYLNLGFERNRYFIKTDKVDPKRQEIFDPFGPKVIGMREPFGDNATEGRVLSISPEETTRPDIPVLLPLDYPAEVSRLRGILARFALEHWQRIKGEKMVDLSKEAGLEARVKQLALPLSIVLQVFPDGEDRFKQYVRERQKEVRKTRAESFTGILFNAVCDLAFGDLTLYEEFGWIYPSEEITGYTKDGQEYKKREYSREPAAITSRMVASATGYAKLGGITKALGGIGLRIANDRIQGKQTRHLVIPSKKRWEEMWKRYHLPEEIPGQQALTNEEVMLPCPDNLKAMNYIEEGG